jgi:molybdopterin converting factor small subunit
LDYDGTTLALNENQLRLRGAGDGNHMLGYLGGSFDGPLLQGYSSVVLKTVSGGDAGGLFMKNGRIGIGTTNPLNGRLHVESSYGVGFSYAYLSSNGSVGTCGGCGGEVSIWAQRRVAAEEFNAFSDERIKEVIGLTDSKNDLATLMDIRVTDYTFVDKISKGNETQKKVIAQELEKIYPSAVKKIKGVVPDIYKLTKASNGVVELKNNLKAGDRVQLIFDEKVQIVDVLSATESNFKTGLSHTGDVFVYGREVDDFRTVDYEAVSMLNLSATQELYKKIQLLENQLAGMSDAVSSLSEQNEKLQSNTKDVEMLKNQLNEIQNMLNIQAEK